MILRILQLDIYLKLHLKYLKYLRHVSTTYIPSRID